MSADYYARLERGKEMHPSPTVIDALARVLGLAPEEHEHVRALAARAARQTPEPTRVPNRTVGPGIQLLLDSLRPNPAYVLSRTGDVLAWNPSGLNLFPGIDSWPVNQRNVARYLFLHPASRALFADWDQHIHTCVASLRALAGTDPHAPDLTELVEELMLKSPDFARLWDRYEVKAHTDGKKTLHHPQVGTLTLGFQAMSLEGTIGQRLSTYYAEPGTPEYDALLVLDRIAPPPAILDSR
jgi:hypothetical protein